MFYPKNFPVQREASILYLLKRIEADYSRIKTTYALERRLRVELQDKELQREYGAKIPSLWWLRFVALRHEGEFSPAFTKHIYPHLTKTKVRSLSGIVPLSLFTDGTGCPFNCVYCPNEPGVPKSYFSDEPAVMRAMRHHFDPYEQTLNRLIMFILSGHPIDKVEIIIKGGTFSFYPEEYRTRFVQRIFDACNTDVIGLIQKGDASDPHSVSIDAAQKMNESASSRVVGINIETRPDFINRTELIFLRGLGVTHVEIGVQMPDDAIYRLIQRGHTVRQVIGATALLKDAGFKVGYHLMPNLPGSTPENDQKHMRSVFESDAFKPDHLKLYPTTVTSHTVLNEWYRTGTYIPYSLDDLLRVIIEFKTHTVPPWVRIGRLTRDITTNTMTNRQFAPNLREIIQHEMKNLGVSCQCIRCREIKDSKPVIPVRLKKISYRASMGKEFFIEFTDAENHSLGFLRLRMPATISNPLPGLESSAIIRELHVYGKAVPIGKHGTDTIQHMNYGKELLEEAERMAREEGFSRIAVIAGIGTRDYYRRHGYALMNTYMVKKITG